MTSATDKSDEVPAHRLVTRAELDKMPRTPGICAYCRRDTMVYALIEFTCRKCVLDDMEAHGE